MNPTVPKAELLERERRWSRPVGIASLVGVVLFVASAVIQSPASSGSDTDAERLVKVNDHASELLFGSVLQAVGLLLFLVPLIYLFLAASGRSNLVRRPYLYLAVLGFTLLAASGVLRAVGLIDVADTYDKELPGLERQDRAAEAGGGGEGEGTGTTETGSTGTATDESSGDDDDDDLPSETRATDLVDDSSVVRAGAYLSLPGVLGLVAGMIYIPLWCMRTGLLSRFWATLGMALGASLVLLPFAQLLLVLWFVGVGMMLLGVWPGGRPPAWDEGEAVPWLKPGQSPPEPSDGTIEGSGREISESPLPEERPPTGESGFPSEEGESQGQRRKKRKRRG